MPLAFLLSSAAPAAAQRDEGGRILGTVFAENAGALAGARVQALYLGEAGPADGRAWFETTTDGMGRYDLAVPHPGCYVMRAFAEGHAARFYGANVIPSDRCVEVRRGAVVEGIDFFLPPGGSVAGRVTSARDASPISEAVVRTMPAWSDSVSPWPDALVPGDSSSPVPEPPFPGEGWALTDEDGNYRIEGLDVGEFLVMSAAEGYVFEYYDDASNPFEATPVPIIAGQETADIDFALSRGGCVLGTVTADDGSPVEGALVIAFLYFPWEPGDPSGRRDGGPGQGGGVTDRNGRYELCGLAPGDYIVQVWADDFLPEFYDDASAFEEADPVSVPADGDAAGIDFALSRGGRIEGLILDAAGGVPVPGAWVSAWPAWSDTTVPAGTTADASGPWGGSVAADSTGRYVLSGLQSGSYFVFAEAAGFLPTFYGQAQDPSSAAPVTVSAPDATTGIDIQLVRGGSMSGTVRDAKTGLPVAGAWVELYLPYMDAPPETTVTRPFPGPGAVTDERGEFRIEGLPSGEHIVLASAWDQGYVPEFYKEAQNPEDATPVGVTAPGEVGGIDFTLERPASSGGEIAGRVSVDSTGGPVSGAVVLAVSLSGRVGVATTGNDGFYLIAGLPEDTYYVLAAAAAMIGEFYDNAIGWEDASPVRVSGPVLGIDFGLTPRPEGAGGISGRVVDSSGEGVPQVWVYAEPDQEGTRGFASTGSDGRYSVQGLAPGSYRVMATRLGHEARYYGGDSAPDAALVRVAASQVGGVDIVLGPQAGGADNTAPLRLLPNAPNPFRRATAIRFRLDRPTAEVAVDILDVGGRLVRRLSARPEGAGEQQVTWDGRDRAGRPAPAGLYVYRVSAGGRTQIGRMVLVD
jgi:protocatechuate 3,4-dioxygenase beta subunit